MNDIKAYFFFLLCAAVSGGMILMAVYYGMNAPTEGYIIRKSFQPASYSVTNETPCIALERYTIVIESTDDEGKKWRKTVALDKDMFYAVELGQKFNEECYCIIKE